MLTTTSEVRRCIANLDRPGFGASDLKRWGGELRIGLGKARARTTDVLVVGLALVAVFCDRARDHTRAVAAALVCLLLVAGIGMGAHRLISPTPPALAGPDVLGVRAGEFDFAPSAFRERVRERREAGIALPDPGDVEVQERYQEFLVQQARDQQLQQAVQSNAASLANVAKQLGLPEGRLAVPASPGSKGVGAATPHDLSVLSQASTTASAPGAQVRSVQDLERLVADYLNLPCPLDGDGRCQEAVDHARHELARGHGLDMNRPDALPTLAMDVAQTFGSTDIGWEPLHIVDGEQVHFHEGLDLAAGYGEPVMAAASGIVAFAGRIPSGALTVELAHAGGLHTLYLHEEQLLVQQGDKVRKGQIIGLVGATGIASGPHVHFQIDDPSGTPIDPMPFLQ